MTTKKLYWENCYLSEFQADIIAAMAYEKDPTKHLIVLDRSSFYPEGGGQPWDEGFIGKSKVLYVFEENGIIYHVVDEIPKEKTEVLCRLDWNRRFDFMQQHLGQHILSSVVEKLYNAQTVGFHLGSDVVTIDISKESLSPYEVEETERRANEYIYKNLPVYVHYPNAEELSKLPLRKQPTVPDGIRVVEIQKTDFSPCGGTHPSYTGEVGIIKIRRLEKMRGNVRIEFVCGSRALNDYSRKNTYINELASLLSSRDNEILGLVEKMVQDIKQLEKENRSLQKNLSDYQVSELYNSGEEIKGFKIISRIYEGMDFKSLQYIAAALSKYEKAFIFLATKNEKAQVIFSRSQELSVDINKLFKEVIGMINGKGGGNPITAQGGGDQLVNLEELLEAAKIKLIHEYL